jgi:hypothetical protein
MVISLLIPLIAIIGSLIIAGLALHALIRERDRSFTRERTLIQAVMAKNLADWAGTNEKISLTPEDLKDQTKLENKLAKYATRIQEKAELEGVPLIP